MKRACPTDVTFCEPADLTLTDDVHGLVSRNCVDRGQRIGTTGSPALVFSQNDVPVQMMAFANPQESRKNTISDDR
jgi:hypothetical protein